MNKNELTPDTVLTAFEKSELMERALDLACQNFEEPTDAHIEWVASRLGWNLLRGESDQSAVTLH